MVENQSDDIRGYRAKEPRCIIKAVSKGTVVYVDVRNAEALGTPRIAQAYLTVHDAKAAIQELQVAVDKAEAELPPENRQA